MGFIILIPKQHSIPLPKLSGAQCSSPLGSPNPSSGRNPFLREPAHVLNSNLNSNCPGRMALDAPTATVSFGSSEYSQAKLNSKFTCFYQRNASEINQTLKVTLLSEEFSPQEFSQGRLYICIGTGQMSSFIYIDMKPKSWRFGMAFNIVNATCTQNAHPAEINRQEKAI